MHHYCDILSTVIVSVHRRILQYRSIVASNILLFTRKSLIVIRASSTAPQIKEDEDTVKFLWDPADFAVMWLFFRSGPVDTWGGDISLRGIGNHVA